MSLLPCGFNLKVAVAVFSGGSDKEGGGEGGLVIQTLTYIRGGPVSKKYFFQPLGPQQRRFDRNLKPQFGLKVRAWAPLLDPPLVLSLTLHSEAISRLACILLLHLMALKATTILSRKWQKNSQIPLLQETFERVEL